MKQIYTLISISATFLFYSAHAQSVPPESVIADPSFQRVIPSPLATQTLMPTSFSHPCADTLVYYPLNYTSSTDSGYSFGNNISMETDCAERYNAVSGTVSQILVEYGRKTGTTGTTVAEIFSINPVTKAPQTLLGTSAAITTGNITPGAYTTYTFTTPVSVTNGFYAGLKLPTTTGDSVAILGTNYGCSTTDSLSWEKFPKGWQAFVDMYGSIYNVDIAILPVADLSAGVNEYSSMGLSLLGAYPNPASDFTTIRYRLDEPSAVSIVVFDLTGRVIYLTPENLLSGTHELNVSLKGLAQGNYYYTIRTNKASLTGKFMVAE